MDQKLSDCMRRAQAGDRSAYEELLREISPHLRRYFGIRAENDEAADDLVQETLISVHRARHAFLAGRPFAPWLFAIARRRLADHWRERSRSVACDALDETMDWVDTRDLAAADGRARDLLAHLPESQRRVVELLKLNGLSIREAAKRLDISEAAVKVTAHRAYERLRKVFSKDGHDS